MSYTIQSATYANQDQTAVVAMTAESGAVAISQDRPFLWGLLQTWVSKGGAIAPFTPETVSPDKKVELAMAKESVPLLLENLLVSVTDLINSKKPDAKTEKDLLDAKDRLKSARAEALLKGE